ncbi:MAG: 16S rRNA (cytidine(1402)-2'-O)-methyltransferase [Chlamydiota bacterium]
MLYIVATPIGHLKDISLRALETLQKVDYILAEDTRHSRVLLNHHLIKKPLLSYHKFNEASRLDRIVEDLKEGKEIALISDAGSPLVADPGLRLTVRLHEENIPYTVIPGACSPICALQLSGFSAERFQFLGFAPKKKGSLEKFLQEIGLYPGVSLFFETSERIKATLVLMAHLLPSNSIALVREITKMHEEVKRGFAKELIEALPHPRGEFVVVVDQSHKKETASSEDVAALQEKGLSRRDAVKELAKKTGVSRRELYKLANKTDIC